MRAVALLILIAAPSLVAWAAHVETSSSQLPAPRSHAAAAFAGGYGYLFGGGGDESGIVRVSPGSGLAVRLTTTLPSGRYAASAASDGTHIFVFGGQSATTGQPIDEILRFDPATGSVTTMGARLPTPRSATAATFDGRYVYVVGGFGPGRLAEVVRYDPQADIVQTLPWLLQRPRSHLVAAVSAGSLYVMGGYHGEMNAYYRQVEQYTLATGAFVGVQGLLPRGLLDIAAAWDGRSVLMFGGTTLGQPPTDAVVRYTPSTNEIVTVRATLPSARSGAAAIFDGRDTWILGGLVQGARSREILRFEARPDGVGPITAAPALEGGCRVSWLPPPPESYSALVAYHIYRSADLGPEVLHAVIPNAVAYHDARAVRHELYVYRVAPVDVSGYEGAPSLPAPCKPVAPIH